MNEPSEVIAHHRDQLLAIEGVTGVAWGLSPTIAGRQCILVYGSAGTSLPESLDDLPVELIVSGEFRPH